MNLGQFIGELLLRVEAPAAAAMQVPKPAPRAPADRRGVRLSPTRLKILKFMRRRSSGVRLHEVAVCLGRPTTHVSGFLTTLVRDGLLEREGEAKGYVYQLTLAGRTAAQT